MKFLGLMFFIIVLVCLFLQYAPAQINPLQGFFSRLLRTRGIRHYADSAKKADPTKPSN